MNKAGYSAPRPPAGRGALSLRAMHAARAYNDAMRMLSAFLLLALMTVSPALASTVYQCVASSGRVRYQGTPCPAGQRQTVRHFADAAASVHPPASSTSRSPAWPASPRPSRSRVVRTPRAPSPVLFRCVRATDGSTYLSSTGRTRPYLAPLGMVHHAHGSIRHRHQRGKYPGSSAPELMPDPTPAMIGGSYTRVRDSCRQLPPRKACAALRAQYEANEEDIRKAFESDRGPLRKRRHQLHRQMAGCRE